MLSVKVYTLTNGLRVVWYPDPTHSIYMTLTTRGGSRFERFEELGISHVLEHLCVRNPNLHREMELLGDGLANAETDLEDISYFFSFPPRNLLKGVELLGRLWNSPVSAEEFERERAVIGIEYVAESTDPECLLGFTLPRLKAAERLALAIFHTYLGDPELFSSVLFDRVRNDLGLVYGIWSGVESFYDSTALKVRWTCA